MDNSEKKFILKIGTYAKYFAGAYIGTIEEMSTVLNNLGIEITEIVNIQPHRDLGVTYNRAMKTKMSVIGHDYKAQEEFLAEYNQLAEKYSSGTNRPIPNFSIRDVEHFFKERPIETDAVEVLIADNTTFVMEYFDEIRNTVVFNASERDFEQCSKISEDLIWNYLRHFGMYKND